jgi:hypothetical protein
MVLDQEQSTNIEDTLAELLRFPLMEAVFGRRSRRFCLGSEIPDGVLAFKSKHKAIKRTRTAAFAIYYGWSYRLAFCHHASQEICPIPI